MANDQWASRASSLIIVWRVHEHSHVATHAVRQSLYGVYTIQQTSNKLPANFQQTSSSIMTYGSKRSALHLLEVCWTFAGSCKHPITVMYYCLLMVSGVFRGAWCDGRPLWPDHENFLQATLYEKVRFFAVFQQISEKMGEFAASIKRSKQKVFQLQGGKAPLTTRLGALLLHPAGGSAHRPPL